MSSSAAPRHVGYDMLRSLACLMVVILHASAQYWYILPTDSPDWAILHLWNTAARGAVPVFFMLSGALFLDAPPTKKLWTRNIPRLLSVYIVWSLLYGIDNMTLLGFLANPAGVIDQAMVGRYHLWFLPAMIGIYLLLPALYAIVHHDGGRALRPYLAVFGVFGILCGTAAAFEGMIPWAVSVGFQKIVPELCGYCGYFILGYVLAGADTSRIRRRHLILFFTASVALTVWAGIAYSRSTGMATALLQDHFTLPSCLEAVCLFLLFRPVRQQSGGRCEKIFAELSACTLGVYLLHPFVLDQLQSRGLDTASVPVWAGVPMITAIVTLICLSAAALLRRIPMIGKWIV